MQNREGLGVGDVAGEHLVGQRQAVLVECHPDGHLPAIAALLLVLSVAGFRVPFAKPFEVGVGHVVEDHAAAQGKEVGLVGAQGFFDGLAMLEQVVAGVVKPVFGGFCEPHAKDLGQGGALGPIDERPLAQRGDQAVGDHKLRGADPAGIEPQLFEQRRQSQLLPGLKCHELGSELHVIAGINLIEDHAVEGGACRRLGRIGTAEEMHDARHPDRRLLRQIGVQKILRALQILLDGAGDAVLFALGNLGIAQGGQHALTRKAFVITIRMNELHQRSALDELGSEIHLPQIMAGKKREARSRRSN